MKNQLPSDIESVLENADLLHDTVTVEDALKNMAAEITARLTGKHPLILSVMTGGIVPTGMLLPLLDFPLQLDYIHATRYRGKTIGNTLNWLKKPEQPLSDRVILLIDDILDKGITLFEITQYCKQVGAQEVFTAVLIEKKLTHDRPLNHADFTGLSVPDRYVFGYGMDYHNYHRNCAGIYALKEE